LAVARAHSRRGSERLRRRKVGAYAGTYAGASAGASASGGGAASVDALEIRTALVAGTEARAATARAKG